MFKLTIELTGQETQEEALRVITKAMNEIRNWSREEAKDDKSFKAVHSILLSFANTFTTNHVLNNAKNEWIGKGSPKGQLQSYVFAETKEHLELVERAAMAGAKAMTEMYDTK